LAAHRKKLAAFSALGGVYADPAKGGASGVYFAHVIDRLGIADQLMTCSGTMIEPSAMSPSPETVVLTLGPAQKIAFY
jgi:molybdate transport system substrate-binding protein